MSARTVWLLAAAIILAGAALRLINLGSDGFSTGELFHVFAARSHVATGNFDVPMLGDYQIARPVTLVTAAVFRIFGEGEFVARLPFALASVAFLGISFAVVRRLFSNGVALVYLFIVALTPLSVQYAREVRMFSLHQMFFFAAATSFLIGFEDLWRVPRGSGLRSFRMDYRWLGAAATFTAAAWVLHRLTAFLVVVIGAYLLAMAIAVWSRSGIKRALASRYGAGLVVMAVAAALAVKFAPRWVSWLLGESATLYGWQRHLGLGPNFYRYILADQYPGLLFVYPVAIYASVRQYGRRGLFFAVAFAPIVLMLSLLVARKSERYLMFAFPFFAVTAAAAIAPTAAWAREKFNAHFGARAARQRILALALFAPVVLVFGHPWLEISARIPFRSRNPDWKSVDATFRKAVREGRVITTNPRAFLYYFDRYPDHYRTVELAEGAVAEPGRIVDADAFHSAVMRGRDVYFIGAEWNFHNNAFMTADMRNSVQFNMAPVDHGGDRRILAFHRN